MKYLIIVDKEAFLTNWYEYENNYSAGMIVVDADKHLVTFDGINWKQIEEDHL